MPFPCFAEYIAPYLLIILLRLECPEKAKASVDPSLQKCGLKKFLLWRLQAKASGWPDKDLVRRGLSENTAAEQHGCGTPDVIGTWILRG